MTFTIKPMRISAKEKEIIVQEAWNEFGKEARVILFGSRVNDQACGGDIDLMVIPLPDEATLLYRKKIRYLVHLKEKLEDQKIDVLIGQPDDCRGIIKTALMEGVTLC